MRGAAHNYNYKIYDEEPKPHTKQICFPKWPKQQDNVSRIAHLPEDTRRCAMRETLSRCFGHFGQYIFV